MCSPRAIDGKNLPIYGGELLYRSKIEFPLFPRRFDTAPLTLSLLIVTMTRTLRDKGRANDRDHGCRNRGSCSDPLDGCCDEHHGGNLDVDADASFASRDSFVPSVFDARLTGVRLARSDHIVSYSLTAVPIQATPWARHPVRERGEA